MVLNQLKAGDRLIHPTSPGSGEVTDISGDTVTLYWFTGLTNRLTLEQLHKAGFVLHDGTPLMQPHSKSETFSSPSGNPPNKVSRSNRGSHVERKFFRRGDKIYGPYNYLCVQGQRVSTGMEYEDINKAIRLVKRCGLEVNVSKDADLVKVLFG
jgi:hypothetical protein